MASDNSAPTLRETFRSTADRLLESLSSMSDPYIDRDKLPHDAFAISYFDPEDNTSLESSGWLFTPMPQANLHRYPPNCQKSLLGGRYPGFEEFRSNPIPTTLLEEMEQSPATRTRILERCLETMFIRWRRKLIRKSLVDKTKWEPVVYPNKFLSREGLLSRYLPPGWSGWVYENVPSFPHIMMLRVQKVSVTEDEMLLGEIGPIVQAIRNRLDQEEFADTTFFPVLIISLSGPQHGRITQGCFDRSGILQLKMSKLYSFETEQEAPFDLFLRFLANTPKEHPEENDVMA